MLASLNIHFPSKFGQRYQTESTLKDKHQQICEAYSSLKILKEILDLISGSDFNLNIPENEVDHKTNKRKYFPYQKA